MAFCPKCGAQLQENTSFCMSCGTKVPDGGSEAMYNQYQANYAAQPVYAPPVQNPVARTSPAEVVRSFAKAPLFIDAIVALPALLGIAANVCFGILIFQYCAAMRPLMYGNMNPGMPYNG